MKVSDVRSFECGPVTWSCAVDMQALKARISSDPAAPEGVVVAGLTDCLLGQVIINPEQSEDHMRATLWHETWHAAYDLVGGLRLSAEPSEDDVILQLSGILLDTLRRNGSLTAALLHGSPAALHIARKTRP